MRVYSTAEMEHFAHQAGNDEVKVSLLNAYQQSRVDLGRAIASNAPHRELALLRSKRSAARFALSRAIDPHQDARRARENIKTLERRREKEARKSQKLQGNELSIAQLKLGQIDSLIEGQRWLLQLFTRSNS